MKKLLLFLLLAVSTPAAAKAPSAATPALWVVQDPDTTIYLFGTVHVLKPGLRWFDGTVKAAFESADTLVVEVLEPEAAEMQRTIMKLAVDADGPPLSEKLSPEAREKYKAAMKAEGIPWEALERLEPWMAGMTLAVAPLGRLGYSAEAGVEKILVAQAQGASKTIVGLETVEQQLGYFDGLAEEDQIAFLNATVDGLPGMEGQFAALVEHWSAGKPDALAREMNASLAATPVLAKTLLFDRNARWAEWIRNRMEQPGTLFLAVGAGHLAGAQSVQDSLKALGLMPRRVKARDVRRK